MGDGTCLRTDHVKDVSKNGEKCCADILKMCIRDSFHPEYRFGFGAFNTQLVLDVTNGLFRLKDDESTIVFEKSALKSFRITEDKEPLFTGTARCV